LSLFLAHLNLGSGFKFIISFIWLPLTEQIPKVRTQSSNKDAGTANGSDPAFSGLGEELGLDDNGLVGEAAAAEDLEVAGFCNVDDWDLLSVCLIMSSCLCRHERPKLVNVYCRAEVLVPLQVIVPHPLFTEVTGMARR